MRSPAALVGRPGIDLTIRPNGASLWPLQIIQEPLAFWTVDTTLHVNMPAYMDIHEIGHGVSAEEIARAHAQDLAVQEKYGVSYQKYWVNEAEGKVFCLCHAPNAEAAEHVHREAHGAVAKKIIQVEPEMARLFLGGSEVSPAGEVLLPGKSDVKDPGIRTILFTDNVGEIGRAHV